MKLILQVTSEEQAQAVAYVRARYPLAGEWLEEASLEEGHLSLRVKAPVLGSVRIELEVAVTAAGFPGAPGGPGA